MDQGELEALAITLPEDLAEFVVEDNEKFRNEITQWDKDQEQKRQQQQTHVEGQEADTSVVSSACDSNEVQVGCQLGSRIHKNLAYTVHMSSFLQFSGCPGKVDLCQQSRAVVNGRNVQANQQIRAGATSKWAFQRRFAGPPVC